VIVRCHGAPAALAAREGRGLRDRGGSELRHRGHAILSGGNVRWVAARAHSANTASRMHRSRLHRPDGLVIVQPNAGRITATMTAHHAGVRRSLAPPSTIFGANGVTFKMSPQISRGAQHGQLGAAWRIMQSGPTARGSPVQRRAGGGSGAAAGGERAGQRRQISPDTR